MQRERTSVWLDGIQRHLEDLKEDAYEGASGAARHARYVAAVELLTPIGVDVLQQVNASLLRGTGDVSVRAPGPDGDGGLIGSWLLSWPELSESSSRLTGKALQPVTISAVFPPGFTHPHLVAGGPVNPRAASLAAWPMQVTSREDAEQQRPVLWAIAAAEVHDRIYQSTWRIIPL
ncbi:MAG TPA: hypothetical protein VGR77_05670 [Candidatus Dormibacteraeota bacterium]|nr:hypothetical protein [Candidatus Dormibacteraeota bacterium]